MNDSKNTIPFGYCHCGCNAKTTFYRGHYKNFIEGHNRRVGLNPAWKGGKTIHDSSGYPMTWMPDHPRAQDGRYVLDHILTAEKALGKPLPPKAVVHHHTPNDLVICENQAYHMLIHQRTRSYNACGNAAWRKCQFCHEFDDPENMMSRKDKNHRTPVYYHGKCVRIYDRKRAAKKREANRLRTYGDTGPPVLSVPADTPPKCL